MSVERSAVAGGYVMMPGYGLIEKTLRKYSLLLLPPKDLGFRSVQHQYVFAPA